MGEDLIVNIVVGFKDIPAANLEAAAQKLLYIAKVGGCPVCDHASDVPQPYMMLHLNLPKRGKCKSCYGPLNPYKKVKTIEEAREMVMGLVGDWPRFFLDAAWRPHPNDAAKIIGVAGELSWGNTPDSAGFQALDRLAKSGVYSELGFE